MVISYFIYCGQRRFLLSVQLVGMDTNYWIVSLHLLIISFTDPITVLFLKWQNVFFCFKILFQPSKIDVREMRHSFTWNVAKENNNIFEIYLHCNASLTAFSQNEAE